MADHSLHLSESFCISSRTVTVDLAHAKILLILWRKTGEYLLPKGRKNIGETLEQAALRETFEETGYDVKLLPISIKTLATVPASEDKEEKISSITEPVAVQQRTTKEGTA
jgi:8-oxo-dGTP pyrophosphatase MutT (NUDIX family)